MSLDLAALVWKETRQFMHDTGDIREAANHVVEALMSQSSAEEIREAFKFDGAIKHSTGFFSKVKRYRHETILRCVSTTDKN